jgi:hypothetical protein
MCVCCCVGLCVVLRCCCWYGLMCCWFWVDGSWKNENGYWWCCYCDVWVLFDVRILLVKWWCYWFLLFGYGVGYWWDFCVLLLMNFFSVPFSFAAQPLFIVTKRWQWDSVNVFMNFQLHQAPQCVKPVPSIFLSSNSVSLYPKGYFIALQIRRKNGKTHWKIAL